MSTEPLGETPRLIVPELTATTVEAALTEMSERLAAAGVVDDPQGLAAKLLARERLGCTGLGAGVGIPHCKWKGIDDVVLAIGRAPAGIDFRSADGVPVTLILLVLSPADAPALHLQALARISRRLKSAGVADNLRRAGSPEEIRDVWSENRPHVVEARG